MKRAYSIIGCLIALTFPSGCRDKDGGKYFESTAFIVTFYEAPEKIELGEPLTYESGGRIIRELRMKGCDRLSALECGKGGRFDRLCRKYGDTGYHRSLYVNSEVGDYPRSPEANGESYRSMRIESAETWDAAHPAHSDLGDLVRLESFSYYPFIRSNYTLPVPETSLSKRIADLQPEDMRMLGTSTIATLYFDTPPDSPGTYPVTVTLTTDEDKVYEAMGELTFRSEQFD